MDPRVIPQGASGVWEERQTLSNNKCYQNCLRGYPELPPHQKQSVLRYLEPPKSQLGQNSCCFFVKHFLSYLTRFRVKGPRILVFFAEAQMDHALVLIIP